MKLKPGHIVAIFGGATAGSEAAYRFAKRGINAVVFEQNKRPYGKIEDGLPRWHEKLQNKEKAKIDSKLTEDGVCFVPEIKLGRDLDFREIMSDWGFSAVLLANGAWKDRGLSFIDNDVKNNGLIYQNSFVYWFNHKNESDFSGQSYKAADNAIVIGGGLASLDVAKILMFETVTNALAERGITTDPLELDHKSIPVILEKHNLSLGQLGIEGCTVYYRRGIKDMPLAQMPEDADDVKKEKVYRSREKILENYQKKYLFKVVEYSAPAEALWKDGKITGMKFSKTEIVNGRVVIKENSGFDVQAPQIVLSIGSIPEPIKGIEMSGELYNIEDFNSGKLKDYENVFGLGNVVTGKGNIKVSADHGKEVSNHVMESFLAWREEDYEELLNRGEKDAEQKVESIARYLSEKKLPDDQTRSFIESKIKSLWEKSGYEGNYSKWIEEHTPQNIPEESEI